MWFRRDLRLADLPPLVEAAHDGREVLALYVVDRRLRRVAGEGRLGFLRGCLAELDKRTSGRLVVRSGDPATVVAQVAREVGAASVHATSDFGPYGRVRDEAVARSLDEAGIEWRADDSPFAVAPGTLHTKSGGNYRVFTPFHRAWKAEGWEAPLAEPEVRWLDGLATEGLPGHEVPSPSFFPGEIAAHDQLGSFLEVIGDYGEARNRPDHDGTSRLSPYLHTGCIHPRQILDAVSRLGGDGGAAFARQLCWRDFYADVLFHRPDSAQSSLQPHLAPAQVDTGPVADARFEAWIEGRTGYPLVDAGMRQLRAEGWMPNRVRMVVASFLVKDLHLPWQRGAAAFDRDLIDADLANNVHGWQWVAGVGTDPAPYDRVFNPVLQSRRFDPQGTYIRTWVPELADVPAPDVHEPWSSLFSRASDYPGPIVDHAAERIEALARRQRGRS